MLSQPKSCDRKVRGEDAAMPVNEDYRRTRRSAVPAQDVDAPRRRPSSALTFFTETRENLAAVLHRLDRRRRAGVAAVVDAKLLRPPFELPIPQLVELPDLGK